MKAIGIIFSNSHELNLQELTFDRTMAAVPFAGRFRMIDLVLSGMSNSGINKVAVIAERNYHSLVTHIGAGKEWDLVRKNSGLTVFTPFGSVEHKGVTSNRIEALAGMLEYLEKAKEELVVITDSNAIGKFAYDEMIEYHLSRKADITAAYRPLDKCKEGRVSRKLPKEIFMDDEDRIVKIVKGMKREGNRNSLLHIWIIGREKLISLIREGIASDYHSFSTELIANHLQSSYVLGYEYKGFYGKLDSIADYLKYNLAFLDAANMKEVFGDPKRPIYTHVKDSPPTSYGPNAVVKNSLIASGCIIDGTVENSMLFRGVHVKKGAVVRDSILMAETFVSSGADLSYLVTDKRVLISENRHLAGAESLPFYIARNTRV